MKKMLLATAEPCSLGCTQQTFTVSKQTSGEKWRKGNHHPSFLRFTNWAEENCRCNQICGSAENIIKTENPANIRKWIARFYYFEHLYSAGSACVLLTIIT